MNSFDLTPSERPSSRKCGTGCRRSVEGSRRCLKRDQASASCGNNTCQTESHFRLVSVCAVVLEAWKIFRCAAMRAAALYQDDLMPVDSISAGGASALGESLVRHGSWPIGAWDVRFPRRHTSDRASIFQSNQSILLFLCLYEQRAHRKQLIQTIRLAPGLILWCLLWIDTIPSN